MAQLYFYFSSMNAGKSSSLLQSSFNYRERGMVPLLFTFALANRQGHGKIESRIGMVEDACVYDNDTSLLDVFTKHPKIDCVLIDEAQFLTKKQVRELVAIVDEMKVPVLCYGLRTDFKGELFEGSAELLAKADKLVELKTICHCGRKATMVIRHGGGDGQVAIGGNEMYESVCRKHWYEHHEKPYININR